MLLQVLSRMQAMAACYLSYHTPIAPTPSLQTVPESDRAALERCRRDAMTVPGLLEITEEHFWAQVGSRGEISMYSVCAVGLPSHTPTTNPTAAPHRPRATSWAPSQSERGPAGKCR